MSSSEKKLRSPKKPVSEKQLAAHRANAARSTGPTSGPGKACLPECLELDGPARSPLIEDIDGSANRRSSTILRAKHCIRSECGTVFGRIAVHDIGVAFVEQLIYFLSGWIICGYTIGKGTVRGQNPAL